MGNQKGYSLFDVMLLIFGLVISVIVGLYFNAQWFIIVNTILALLCVFTQAKGKIITQFLGLLWSVFYVYIAFTQQLYGEVILNFAIVIPMYIYGVYNWVKNRQKDSDVVLIKNTLSKNEWIFFIVGFVGISIGVYFLLKALNTAQLINSTLAFITILPALYFLIRRHPLSQVFFLINDLVGPILWITLCIQGQPEYIVIAINNYFQVIYDIYGIVNWRKLAKAQKKLEQEEMQSLKNENIEKKS